ncbi:MAG: gamma-glutamyltransferase [Bradyrhizobium sp.]|uniref:gamma-glutamyltransferase n=1 Tax=Bradyrhizobium sp. TaxID=376 RepID=UPI00120ECF55|nr:gamma-glutamyltransferase [Bradyrhizobium sp.]THD72733.1 MAG: gamma-glutamyltransferase [Bradyrhizobium sp.]
MVYAARSWRPVIMGRSGAVASNHPLATQAGLLALQRGGNAVDAAIAVAMVLSVVEPHMSGLGGDGFYHVYNSSSREAVIFNGTGSAPAAATPERYAAGMPLDGPLSVSTPGAVGALEAMHRRFGSQSWKGLLAPAIDVARNGFAATRTYSNYANEQVTRLLADRRSASVFLLDGRAPQLGSWIVQPDLANTLEILAAEGAFAFYRGRIADALIAGCLEIGALLSSDDLAEFEPEIQTPIEIDYRGFTVRQSPPNSTGWVLLQELKLAEQFDLASLGPLSADLIHILVEAKKLAFADRERFSADPRFFAAPLRTLLSDEYAASRAKLIDIDRASVHPVPAGSPGDTTYFCIVDGKGNAISAIQSINALFGSGFTAGSTGVLLNSRMSVWHLDQNHPNYLQPRKRTRHTMNTPMVFKDGKVWCVFGTPGADYQVQVNLQILTSLIDFGFDPQQAAEAPRWSSTQPGQDADYPHSCPDALNVESRFPAQVLQELAQKGHSIVPIGDMEGPCSVAIIQSDVDTGIIRAGSDPRRDGWALAY